MATCNRGTTAATGEALAEPATALPRLGTADCHCRGHTGNERNAGEDIGDPDGAGTPARRP
ncbi:MAG TPA: hypothetical protein VN920_05915 [Pyrinomonadaceae bacterium]|nr:hypothetical protein [Pyrinomonadaceae bacterium]